MTNPVRQLVIGLFALPLSMVPFAAYGTMTPEGRLVRDKAIVAISPPRLPGHAASVADPPRYSGAVAALVYHGIGSGADGDGDGGFAVSPKRFGEHLAALKAAGMHAVTAAEVAAARRPGGPALPDNAVMISFDDGRADAMMWADPLLKQSGMKATMFVITDSATKHGLYYADWDRLRAASGSGRWDIQSHTASLHREHKADGGEMLPALTSLYRGESIEEYRTRVHEDLARAWSVIKEKTGRAPTAFAYPFGAYGAERTNNPLVHDVLAREVARFYDVAFEQDGQDEMRLMTADDAALELRRLEVGNWSAAELLRRIGAAADRTFPPAAPSDKPADPAAAVEPPVLAPVAVDAPAAPLVDPATTTAPTAAPAPVPVRRPSTTTTVGAAPAPAPPPTTVYVPPPTTTTTAPPPPTTTTTRPPTTTTTICTLHPKKKCD